MFIRLCLAITALAVTPLLAYSGGCVRSRVVAVVKPVAVVQAYVAPVVAAYVAPVYPVYSANYDNSAAILLKLYEGQRQENQQLRQEIGQLRNELRGGKGGAGQGNDGATTPIPPEAGAGSWQQFANQACAKCHMEKVAAELGKGFVLVENDGSIPVYSVGEQTAIRLAIGGTTQGVKIMPPASTLTQEQRQAAIAAFNAHVKTQK